LLSKGWDSSPVVILSVASRRFSSGNRVLRFPAGTRSRRISLAFSTAAASPRPTPPEPCSNSSSPAPLSSRLRCEPRVRARHRVGTADDVTPSFQICRVIACERPMTISIEVKSSQVQARTSRERTAKRVLAEFHSGLPERLLCFLDDQNWPTFRRSSAPRIADFMLPLKRTNFGRFGLNT
jgi:hypothetical protein